MPDLGSDPILETHFDDLGPRRSGKVRDVYDLGDRLLIVATDRVSAFDVVLPDAIPDKGKVLTRLSAFWFRRIAKITPHHFLSIDLADMPEAVRAHGTALAGRATLARKAKPYPVEAIVRGYLAGSGFKDYAATGAVCGHELPRGLELASKLERPLFTPSTKAAEGHDKNISFERMRELLPDGVAETIRDRSLEIYRSASEHAADRGVLLADTKFEFGELDGEPILIDEILSPDSSRFWPADDYRPGRAQASFDKQIVRDWLEESDWDKRPPGPSLPPEIIERTRSRYLEIYERLTGTPFRT